MGLNPAFSAFIARPSVSRVALRVATWLDRPLMRLSRGRFRLSFVIPVCLVSMRGARTGENREVPLLYVPLDEGDDAILLVASNGGQPRHPAWYHNLRAHPQVRVLFSDGERPMMARLLAGDERSAGMVQACGVYPGYAVYEQRCERQIPVFRLSPVAASE
ncbi:MAG: nitroreductase/quinone reductase family protein [Pseudomonadota bacterium]